MEFVRGTILIALGTTLKILQMMNDDLMEKGNTAVTGIVSSVRNWGAAGNSYTLLSYSGAVYNIRSEAVLSLMDIVETDLDSAKSGTLPLSSCSVKGKAASAEYSRVLGTVLAKVFKKMPREAGKRGVPKELRKATEEMHGVLHETAEYLVRKFVSGAPVAVRFHNDSDGSSGALGIYLALERFREVCRLPEGNLFWRMNKSIAYDDIACNEDSFLFGSFACVEKPMVLIVDFGTSQESEMQISSAYKKFDIVMLDHHPVYEGFPKEKLARCINTWLFGSDSDYTAGFLGCIFAEHIAKVEGIEDIMMASLIGDFSIYGDRSRSHADKLAIVLDYITSVDGRSGAPMQKVSPKGISALIEDKEKFDDMYSYSLGLLNEALDRGTKSVRHYKGKECDIYLLDFYKAASTDSKYPLPGRYSSRLQDRMEPLSQNGAITLVHYGNFLSARMSRRLVGKVDLLGAMARVKDDSEHVLSFGGHECAASIRLEKEYMEKVTKLLLGQLGANAQQK